ncbi:hypothetical protein L1887_56054 [Cichorium endivia]|nr:hypothetical protein L1887_56054 [Cichorium endivia]
MRLERLGRVGPCTAFSMLLTGAAGRPTAPPTQARTTQIDRPTTVSLGPLRKTLLVSVQAPNGCRHLPCCHRPVCTVAYSGLPPRGAKACGVETYMTARHARSIPHIPSRPAFDIACIH